MKTPSFRCSETLRKTQQHEIPFFPMFRNTENKKRAAEARGSSSQLGLSPQFWNFFGRFRDSSTYRFIVRLSVYLLIRLSSAL
jgi:hypothetical protein